MNIDALLELLDKASALAEDVDNSKASGNDVADKLESYAKALLEYNLSGLTEQYCQLMVKKARCECHSHPLSSPLVFASTVRGFRQASGLSVSAGTKENPNRQLDYRAAILDLAIGN